MASPNSGVRVTDFLGRGIPFVATSAAPITESDTNVFPSGCLYIGTGGDLVVMMDSGAIVTFSNVADASFLPILVKMVYTASTCADILVLY